MSSFAFTNRFTDYCDPLLKIKERAYYLWLNNPTRSSLDNWLEAEKIEKGNDTEERYNSYLPFKSYWWLM